MSMAIFSPKLPALSPPPAAAKTHLSSCNNKPYLSLRPVTVNNNNNNNNKKLQFQLLATAADNNNNGSSSGVAAAATTVEEEESAGSNGSPPPVAFGEKVADAVVVSSSSSFEDARWVAGTWDLKQFSKDGNTDWDALIDAEVKRRKWMEQNPQSSSNEEPIVFDTSIIPWWAWMKRFHLPEAELLNGRAAMIGFFMAYFVDSLTGVGLVDQMGNFFCKTLLFVAVAGVLLIRKNEDLETIKKLLEETTFYDKQWQATWQDDTKNKV
ncbi:hypothetical protein BUALT_Bualt05G0078200 [Buddleja alternifolia]|uniref:Uncharacterized protein n=1 Tax=Buddleja alternifolia TaxID=168488 RepID=A0AAV6XQJ9_9LAMI|nr:hypothetical protein BUALT_Bualt05G0078200 [Buddleja alternifolia]